MVEVAKQIRDWWYKQTTAVVHVGENAYAVRKYSFTTFKFEYLDLSIAQTGPLNSSKLKKLSKTNSGSAYGLPAQGPFMSPPHSVNWWATDETVSKYCVSKSLQSVVDARNALINFRPVKKVTLPTITKVANVDLELAQQKLAGVHLEEEE
tara:strand:- start:111 stop:563 length:453 start_codon:yes stop_codon:yes gene_type:complete